MVKSSNTSRDRLLETTAQLLELQGYHATGLNQITKDSGAPKGSLYYYFPEGKEELCSEAVARSGQAVAERIRFGLSQAPEPLEAIVRMLQGMAEHVGEAGDGCGSGVSIAAVALETASSSERLREACAKAYDSWQAAFREKLMAGGYSAERAERLSLILVSLIEGTIILSRTSRSGEPFRQLAEEIPHLLAKKEG